MVDINRHMHPDDEAQLQNVPRNFFHQLYIQTIFRTLVLPFLYIETFTAALVLAFWIARSLIDLVGGATYFV